MLIGITGHARHGKDSTADVIVKHYGFRKHALADVMKEACRDIFGWTDEYLYGDLKDVVDPRYGVSPRHALQSLGTEWGQYELSKYDSFKDTTGRRLWVNSLLSRVNGDTVIADVRFPHEVDAIREHGGIIIKVVRDWPVDLTHESERGVEMIVPDYIIRNRDTLDGLDTRVCMLMDELLTTGRII